MYVQIFKNPFGAQFIGGVPRRQSSRLKKNIVFVGRKYIAALFVFSLCAELSFASEGQEQASSFTRIYTQLCLKNISNLDVIRKKLEAVPALSVKDAANFLANRPGNAWPVPDKHGTFVLALPSDMNFCAVYARKASTASAIKLFTELMATAPPPLLSTLVKNEQIETAENGVIQTLSYEWAVPNAPRKMLFTLTTASSDSAHLQVLGSAAVVDR